MSRRIYDLLKDRPKLQRKTVSIHAVNSGSLKVDGSITLPIDIGGYPMCQEFYIVKEINRNIILGQDFLEQNGVRIYFDLGCMRIAGKVYVKMERDIHIASVVRAHQSIVLKPQSAKMCYGKIRDTPELPSNQEYQTMPTDRGFLTNEPGISVINSVCVLGKNRLVPILLETNKTIKIHRHSIIAKTETLLNTSVRSVNSVGHNPDIGNRVNMNDLQAPPTCKDRLQKLISENADLFANKDSELGHTDAVRMQIDTQGDAPIRLRPYRAPINKRKVIDEAIDEMLSANIVRRSRSPWCFRL